MSKWKKGLRAKLLVMGMVPVFVLGILSYISISALGEFSDRLSNAYRVRAKLIETAGEIDSSVHALGRWMWITYGLAGQTEARNNFIKRSLAEIDAFDKTMATYLALPRNEKIKELFSTVEREWPLAKAGALEAINYFKNHNEKDNEIAKQTMQAKLLPHLVPMTKTMDEIKTQMHQILDKEIENADVFAARVEKQIWAVSTLSTIFCFLFSILLASSLAKKLTKVSVSLHEASLQVHSASGQIASSSEELSQAATEQASSLEETAASLAEINNMISKSADSSKMTSSSSSHSQTKAEEGRAAVEQMINSMTEISQSNEAIMGQVNQSNQRMADIVKVIQEIGDKTKVINDIVFQTKLLSFNASVEAARAGEHGKGFAVVAEEVGNLAQMSGNAAREISNMLTGSISKVEGIVQDTKTKVESLVTLSKQKVESGVSVARGCANVLGEIVENVSKVSELSHEISKASQEQAVGVAEINRAMTQMDTVTQQNAASSEQTASAAEQLSAQAENLKGAVEDLVQTIDGDQPKTVDVSFTGAREHRSVGAAKGAGRVIHLKSAKKPVVETKMAAGGDSTPDRNHNGFTDV